MDKLEIFCITILIILNVLIIINGLNLDCSKCAITFTSKNQITTKQTINITDIYEEYLNDNCLVEYSPSGIIVKK